MTDQPNDALSGCAAGIVLICAPILMFALWLAPKILAVVGLLWLLGWLK